PIPGVMISYGAPKSCTTVSGTNSPSPTKTLKKLKRPSRICGSAVNPRCASCAASTPLRAASPAWSGFVMVPKFCRNPPAFEAAIRSAIWACGPVQPRTPAAAHTRGGHGPPDFRFNFHPDHKRRDNVLAARTQGLPERQHCWDHGHAGMSSQMKGHVVKVQGMPERTIRQGRKSGRCVKRCAQDGGLRMTTGVLDKCGNDLARGLSMSGQRDADGVEKRPLCLGHRTGGD